MFCEKCGGQMADGSKFCIQCGAKIETGESVQETAVQESAASVESSPVIAQEPATNFVNPTPAPTPAPEPAPAKSVQQTVQPVQAPQPAPAKPVITNQPNVQPVQSSAPQQPVQQPVREPRQHSTTPLPVWKFIGILLLMGIPILNVIMIFVWSFGSSCNQNTKNYARAVLITFVIFLVLSIVGYFTVWSSISAILSDYNITIMPY